MSSTPSFSRSIVARPDASRRRLSLVACVLACLGVAGDPVAGLAATFPVGRCGDSAGKGGDTLRIAINKAGNNDTVDLSTLAVSCSTVTLTGGEIPINVANLTITGPADRVVSVSGNGVGRVFYHAQSGILHLSSLNLTAGHTGSDGGCVYSKGQVWLYAASMNGCSAAGQGGCIRSAGETFLNHQSSLSACTAAVTGGGVSSAGDVLLASSTISSSSAATGGAIAASGDVSALSSFLLGNSATSAGGAISAHNIELGASVVSGNTAANCGGLYFSGDHATLTSTTIAGNSATTGNGGGICAIANSARSTPQTVTLNSTTVSGNSAHTTGGGIDAEHSAVNLFGAELVLSNSTISGNTAGASGGGIHMFFGNLKASNSTIAFNTAPTGGGFYGMRPNNGGQDYQCRVEAHSSIFADN